MKRIPLTQGKFAIVDAEKYEWLNSFKWCAAWSEDTKSFYAVKAGKRANGKRHQIYMARLILGLDYGDKRQVDHINHNTLDNRISKLRIVTNQQNNWNRKNPKGYYWLPNKKYRSRIGLNDKMIHLGYFHTAEEAHSAYLKAKEIYHKF